VPRKQKLTDDIRFVVVSGGILAAICLWDMCVGGVSAIPEELRSAVDAGSGLCAVFLIVSLIFMCRRNRTSIWMLLGAMLFFALLEAVKLFLVRTYTFNAKDALEYVQYGTVFVALIWLLFVAAVCVRLLHSADL
jgi:hypothetical protein